MVRSEPIENLLAAVLDAESFLIILFAPLASILNNLVLSTATTPVRSSAPVNINNLQSAFIAKLFIVPAVATV